MTDERFYFLVLAGLVAYLGSLITLFALLTLA